MIEKLAAFTSEAEQKYIFDYMDFVKNIEDPDINIDPTIPKFISEVMEYDPLYSYRESVTYFNHHIALEARIELFKQRGSGKTPGKEFEQLHEIIKDLRAKRITLDEVPEKYQPFFKPQNPPVKNRVVSGFSSHPLKSWNGLPTKMKLNYFMGSELPYDPLLIGAHYKYQDLKDHILDYVGPESNGSKTILIESKGIFPVKHTPGIAPTTYLAIPQRIKKRSMVAGDCLQAFVKQWALIYLKDSSKVKFNVENVYFSDVNESSKTKFNGFFITLGYVVGDRHHVIEIYKTPSDTVCFRMGYSNTFIAVAKGGITKALRRIFRDRDEELCLPHIKSISTCRVF